MECGRQLYAVTPRDWTQSTPLGHRPKDLTRETGEIQSITTVAQQPTLCYATLEVAALTRVEPGNSSFQPGIVRSSKEASVGTKLSTCVSSIRFPVNFCESLTQSPCPKKKKKKKIN